MHIAINPKSIAELVNTLENDEIGAAIRLLNRIVSTGRPVPENRARAVCQLSAEEWSASRDAILEHFIVEDDAISHGDLASACLPPVAGQGKTRAGVTGDIPIVQPTLGHVVPAYTTREKPELVSIKKTAYLTMEEVFERSDQSKNTARAVLASLLKAWPEGDVYKAVSDAGKQQFIVDPRSWIIAQLQRTSAPIASGRNRRDAVPPPQRATPREIVTPKSAGVSDATAARIQERNNQLKLHIPSKSEQA